MQNAEINILPTNTFFLSIKGEDYYIHQSGVNSGSHYFFTDASLFWKFEKIKANLALEMTNITDTQMFTTIIQTANNMSQSIFIIRPRMLIAKIIFNF